MGEVVNLKDKRLEGIQKSIDEIDKSINENWDIIVDIIISSIPEKQDVNKFRVAYRKLKKEGEFKKIQEFLQEQTKKYMV